MTKQALANVVGLFGTCGASRWREDVAIPMLQQANVEYFNPVVEHWDEEAMKREAEHGKSDKVLLQVITGETTAFASLAESGWLALQAYVRGQKLVIVLTDMPEHEEPAKDERGGAFRPNKTRKLLRQHIANLPDEVRDCVFLCEDSHSATLLAIKIMNE